MRSSSVLRYDPNIAGVDEAGRGPLAGPVVVCAVLLPEGFDATGLRDSKKLTASQRESAFQRLTNSVSYQVVIVDSQEIDRRNILQATLWGMAESLTRIQATSAVIDGDKVPRAAPCPCRAIIKGDDHDAAIAAASIIAKVTRDRLMTEYDSIYPQYGFAAHFGYHVPMHVEAIRTYGPTPIHRRSFEPLKTMLNQASLDFGD